MVPRTQFSFSIQRLASFQCSMTVIVCVLLTVIAQADVPRQADLELPEDERQESAGNVIDNHGAVEVLDQLLYRETDRLRFLNSAKLQIREGRFDAAHDFLRRILEHHSDMVTDLNQPDLNHSLKAQAWNLIRDSGTKFQNSWQTTMEDTANAALRRALNSGDRQQLQQVARLYPYTIPGVDAALLLIAEAIQSGRIQNAELLLKSFDEAYGAFPAGPAVRVRIDRLRRIIERSASGRSASPKVLLATEAQRSDQEISAAWPAPVWEWKEDLTGLSADQLPDLQTTMQILESATSRENARFTNWPPTVTSDLVVFRSPFRVVAIDRVNGKHVWELSTDTFKRGVSHLQQDEEEISLRAQSRLQIRTEAPLAGLTPFGTLSSDGELLFFIDHFDLGRYQFPNFQEGFRRLGNPRLQPQRQLPFNAFPELEEDTGLTARSGSRLVAVQLSRDRPVVRWTVGNAEQFPYHFRSESGEILGSYTVNDRSEAVGTLTNHEFLAAPISVAEDLFILSSAEERVWLNCLERSSGALRWQMPLATNDPASPAGIWGSDLIVPSEARLCISADNLILCSLPPGILIAVEAQNGRTRWATSLTDSMRVDSDDHLHAFSKPSDDGGQATFVPVVKNGKIVAAGADSRSLFGIDLQSGTILWQVSRAGIGPGNSGASLDACVVGFHEENVVLTGPSHCRSLSLESGLQNWICELESQTGRACCGANVCLIPEEGGQMMVVDLSTGTAHRTSREFLPPDLPDLAGTLVADRDFVFVATPNQVSAYSRTDRLLQSLDELPSLAESPWKKIRVRAQAELISGDRQAAIGTLMQADTSLQETPELHAFAAELILQSAGNDLTGETPNLRQSERKRQLEEDLLSLETLRTLRLDENQQYRTDLIEQLIKNRVSQQRSTLDPNRWAGLHHRLMRISETWSCRPDLLLEQYGERLQHTISLPATVSESATADSPSRRMLMDAILHPLQFGDASTRLRLAEVCQRNGHEAAAELVLLSSLKALTPREEEQRAVHMSRIMSNRGVVRNGASRQEPLPRFKSMLISEVQTLISSEPLMNGIGSYRIVSPASEEGYLLAIREFSSGSNSLDRFDLSSGHRIDEVSLPFFPENVVQPSRQATLPRLILCSNKDHICAVSVAPVGRNRLLWQRRVLGENKGDESMTLGPFGADYAVWQTSTKLHCSHPLTGDDLWVVALKRTPGSTMTFANQQILGDDEVTIVCGADQETYERFRTRDGQRLGIGRQPLLKNSTSVTFGRKLISSDVSGRVRMFDLLSETDVLQGEPPVVLSPETQGPFRQISEGRIVTISEEQEIVLIDCIHDRIVFRTPTGGRNNTQFVMSLSAFERNGRLFVSLSDEIPMGERIIAAPRLGEARVEFGTLYCLDPATGQLLWSRRMDPSVFPPVCGDRSGQLIAWSFIEHHDERRGATRMANRKLRVQVLNELTGEILAERHDLLPGLPLRCVHDAEARRTTLITYGSEVSITENLESETFVLP